MNRYKVIAGSGHCGTMWLSQVLNEQAGIDWYHHLREHVLKREWANLDRFIPRHVIFDPYWKRLWNYLQQSDVGDANSWPPHLLPDANDIIPIDEVIYLTRNKIQQLYSLSTASPPLGSTPLPPAAELRFQALYVAGGFNSKPLKEWGRFEKLCLLVAANDYMPDWLRAQGLNVSVYSLEELTMDINKLKELASSLTKKRLKELQKNDINRKVEGDRAPSTLWRKLDDDQRDAYREIVGDPEI